jgi:hypothetical protein
MVVSPCSWWFLEDRLPLFSLWSKNHLFHRAYHDLLRVYLKIRPRSSSFIVDTSFVKNVFGHICIGPSPQGWDGKTVVPIITRKMY